ncbi:MAG: Na/Pi cotransporter family protein [Rhizobiales bacterium]|nr:Na/Pi cotransporter family protein [Hyphomicrobiales bacterium]
MPVTHLILNLIGEIALLLWGIHMVQRSVTQAFGTDLRGLLARGLKTRFHAFLVGLGVTALLQSSTATALMAVSFTGTAAVDLVPALAVMLGANVGTTLIVQVLSFDITLVFPVLIAAGVLVHRRAKGTRYRDLGRAAIGLGLMLLALNLIAEAIRPNSSSAAVAGLLAALTREPLLTVAVAAALTWAAHSSVVVILAVISLSGTGLLAPEAAIAMVLGANIGSAINPVLAGTGGDPVKLRLPIGNLLTRIVGTALALPFLDPALRGLTALGPDPGRMAANFHTAFNLAVAALFIGILHPFAGLLIRFLPARPAANDPALPLYLDRSALRTPAVALANAARETLRIADVVEKMLAATQNTFHGDDRDLVARTSRMDDVVDRLHEALQRYIAAISREGLSEGESRRLAEVQGFAINLEHIGDIIDKNLTELAAKRMRLQLSLSPEGMAEIDAMYAQLLDHLRLAVAVFMSNDVEAARRLVAEKEQFRELERRSTEKHFARVREGRVASIETSGLHLDVVRDLKRIEAHLAATAYPLLERTGALKPTRLAS